MTIFSPRRFICWSSGRGTLPGAGVAGAGGRGGGGLLAPSRGGGTCSCGGVVPVRADEVEELQANRRHATEVAGPELSLQNSAELLDLDPGLVPGWIELLGGRCEDDVDTRRLRERDVVRLVARIRGQILVRPELGRIDEEADDD